MAAVGAVVSLLSLSACNSKVNQSSLEDQAFQRVSKTKILRVGYISNPPNLIVDPNTKQISGITHDILATIAENMRLKVEYVEEESWATFVAAVESGRVDMIVAGVWPSAENSMRASFSVPLYFSTIKAYVKQGDDRFDGNLDSVNNPDITIATIDGEFSGLAARTHFPQAKTVSLPHTSDIAQLLLQIQSGKADITFVEMSFAFDYMRKNPEQIQEVKNVEPLYILPDTFVYAKTESKLREALDISIQELHHSGRINKIIKKYERFPGEFLRTALPYRMEN